jgi:hypothetical protein
MRASAAATTMSQASARSVPPATQCPCTAAMTGLWMSKTVRRSAPFALQPPGVVVDSQRPLAVEGGVEARLLGGRGPAHVVARAEVLARALQDDAAHGAQVVGLQQGLAQLAQQGAAEGVALLRPVSG